MQRSYVYRGRRVSLARAYFRSENVILKECKLRLISSEILPWMSLFRVGDDRVSTLKHSTDGSAYLCTKIEFHGLRGALRNRSYSSFLGEPPLVLVALI